MKCPECGQWNRAHFTTCQQCGAPLGQPTAEEPSWRSKLRDDRKPNQYMRVDEQGDLGTDPDQRDELAVEMSELKSRKAAGNELQRKLREDSSLRGAAPSSRTMRVNTDVPFWDVNDDTESTVRYTLPRREASPADKRQPSRRIQVRSDHDSLADANIREYDPMSAEREYSGSWSLPPVQPTGNIKVRLPSRRRGLRIFIRILAVLVFIGVAGLAAYFGVNYYRQKQELKAEENAAVITAGIIDDLAAHIIMIPGEDGQQIYIRELHTSYMVSGGFATIEVADHTWYDDYEGALGETMEVTLTPFLKTASGRQEAMRPITFEIDIPLSPISLTQPDATRIEVSTAMYTMKLKVRPGSKLTINGEDYSDTVDSETGAVSYNATVQPVGDNVFTFTVRSQYCRENSITVTLYREPQDIPLDLAADTYGTTNSSRMKVSATTLPGAVVEVLSPHNDLDITNVDSTGNFTFYALFDKIGNNTITITASSPGKKTSVVNYTVYYLPSPDIYTTKAWRLDESGYAELVGNIQLRAEKTQVYLVQGAVSYFVSEKPQMAVIYTSPDGKSQPVLVENNTSKTLEVGKRYRIYADVSGNYNSMPWLQGRYVYAD